MLVTLEGDQYTSENSCKKNKTTEVSSYEAYHTTGKGLLDFRVYFVFRTVGCQPAQNDFSLNINSLKPLPSIKSLEIHCSCGNDLLTNLQSLSQCLDY